MTARIRDSPPVFSGSCPYAGVMEGDAAPRGDLGDTWGLSRAELARERERLGTVALRATAYGLVWILPLAFLLVRYGIGDGETPQNTATDILVFCALAMIAVSLCFTPGAVWWWVRYESVRRTGWRPATVAAEIEVAGGCLAAFARPGTDHGRLYYVVRYRDGSGARLRGGNSMWHPPPLLAFDRAQPAWVGGSGRATVVLFGASRWGPRRPRAVPAKFIARLPARSQ